jgi:multidrug transporter EmrE-like cation transporter
VIAALLVAAVVTQVVGITALRASAGLRRPGWAVLTFAGLGASVVLIARAVDQGLSLAVSYGIWTGAGIALAAVVGVVLFGDRLRRVQVLGLVLVVLGVVAMNAGGMA